MIPDPHWNSIWDIYSGILSGIYPDSLSEIGTANLNLKTRGWGPAVLTKIWSAVEDAEEEVEVRYALIKSRDPDLQVGN